MSAVVAWGDRVAGGTVTAGSLGTTLISVDNVKDRRLAKVYRRSINTGTPGSTTITADFGATYPIRTVAVLAHTLIEGFVIGHEVELWDGANGTGNKVYDSSSVSPYLPPVDEMPAHHFFVLPSEVDARSMVYYIYVAPGTNTIDIGRLWASNALVIPKMDAAWKQRIIDPSTISRSRGQQVYVDEKQRVRAMDVSFSLKNSEAMYNTAAAPDAPSFQLLGFQAGKFGEAIILPSDDDSHQIHRLGVYGTLSSDVEFRHQGADNYDCSLSIIESR